MGFGEAIKSAFSNYADFSGRASRSEYWFFVLFNVLLAFLIELPSFFTYRAESFCRIMIILSSLVLFIPSLALATRRMHDIGKSGWYLLLLLIPYISWILFLVWFLKDSEPGYNEYGPNPKG